MSYANKKVGGFMSYLGSILSICFLCLSLPANAEDWPQWRKDSAHTASTKQSHNSELRLLWTKNFPPPQEVWRGKRRMNFNQCYEAIVMGKTVFVSSMTDESLKAFDTESGRLLWTFYAEGPIRSAAIANRDKVFVGSDDGYLYCLHAKEGHLLWKVRGLPNEKRSRLLFGNQQLMSLHPVRGAPVLHNGVVYFAAGLWPNEGIYIHAVNADNGKRIWLNRDSGYLPKAMNDHNSLEWDSGLAPQGYLTICNDKLLVPCGRAMLAEFDLSNGRLRKYQTHWGGRVGLIKGCWFTAAAADQFFMGGDLFKISDHARLQKGPACNKKLGLFREPVIDNDVFYTSAPVNDFTYPEAPISQGYNEIQAWQLNPEKAPKLLWKKNARLKIHIKAGNTLYGAGEGMIQALQLGGKSVKPIWSAEVKGDVKRMLAADDKLFVITDKGDLMCYGQATPKGKIANSASKSAISSNKVTIPLLKNRLKNGITLILYPSDEATISTALARYKKNVVVICNTKKAADTLRKKFYGAGYHWPELAIRTAQAEELPPYFASLIITDNTVDRRIIRKCLRPYGGLAVFNGKVIERRPDALKGSAEWSHTSGDAANTLVSQDKRIQGPFTPLWFGNPSPHPIVPSTWGRGKRLLPIICAGRIVCPDFPYIQAIDSYNGKLLWETKLTTLTETAIKTYNKQHYQYVASKNALFLASRNVIYILDSQTGKLTKTIKVPGKNHIRSLRLSHSNLVVVCTNECFCYAVENGEQKWNRKSSLNVFANMVCSEDKVFLVDTILPSSNSQKRRGIKINGKGELVCLDINRGKELWRRTIPHLTGTTRYPLHLAYSKTQDVAIVVFKAFTTFEAITGKLVVEGPVLEGSACIVGGWQVANKDQPMVFDNKLVDQFGKVFDLRTAKAIKTDILWNGGQLDNGVQVNRRGCSRIIGAQYILTTRNANAAYWDLKTKTLKYILGIRSGCSNNMIPACGVINMPDLSQGCSCNYPLAGSMALIPFADLK